MGKDPLADYIVTKVQQAELAFDRQFERTEQVVREFIAFTRNFQLNLVEPAVLWALMTLSRDKDRSKAKERFFAASDALYAFTEHGERLLADDERSAMYASASAMQNRLGAEIGNPLKRIDSFLKQVPENSGVGRITGDLLLEVLLRYMKHASAIDLRELVARSIRYSLACDGADVGLAIGDGIEQELNARFGRPDRGTRDLRSALCTAAQTLQELNALCTAAQTLIDRVHKFIDEGRLVIVDGEIVNPEPEEEEEDD